MIKASIYGRLGADPVERLTKNGNAMVTASLAVAASRPDQDDITEWFSLAAFGKAGEGLLRHRKGDLLSAMGQLYRTRFTGRDGKERGGWSLTVESLISAQIVRPGGRKKKPEPTPAPADDPADTGTPFNDPLPDW